MIDARPFRIEDDILGKDDSLYRGEQMPFEHLTKLILSSIKRVEAKRVVIDSITILMMQYQDKFSTRQGLQAMIQTLELYGVTAILISEESESEGTPLEWYVSSGIIQLKYIRKQDTMERSVQIIKLRGVNHSQQLHLLKISNDGLSISHQNLMHDYFFSFLISLTTNGKNAPTSETIPNACQVPLSINFVTVG